MDDICICGSKRSAHKYFSHAFSLKYTSTDDDKCYYCGVKRIEHSFIKHIFTYSRIEFEKCSICSNSMKNHTGMVHAFSCKYTY